MLWKFPDSDEDENQVQLEVGHGVNSQESPKISVSGERYRRVQHVCVSLYMRSNNNIVKSNTHKLDTAIIASGNPENKAPAKEEGVSNLFEDPKTRIITRVFDRDALSCIPQLVKYGKVPRFIDRE